MPTGLQHGPYGTPSVIPGCYVACVVRGVVKLVGLSEARLPWPIGERDGAHALIVYRGLARALREERAEAVADAWGVPIATVRAWQKAIEHPQKPEYRSRGVHRLWTPEEDATVLAIEDNYEAAAKLGRTPGAIRNRRMFVKRGEAKAADRMRKPLRKKRQQ